MKSLTYKELLETEFSEREWIEISDKKYFLNPKDNIVLEVKPGDKKEYLEKIVSVKENLPEFVERASRETNTVKNAIKAIQKATDCETIIKKLKTLSRYSLDKEFPYRELAETLENSKVLEEFHYNEKLEMNDDLLSKIIITQTIESLKGYSIIHPKLKLLMNLIGKLDSLQIESKDSEENFNLTFQE